MTCEICKSNYDNNLPKCPYCGLNNPVFGSKQCINCGSLMGLEERFCSKCGTMQKVESPKACSNCNAKLKPNAAFCSQCGTSVDNSNIRQTAVSISIPDEELSNAVPAGNAELPLHEGVTMSQATPANYAPASSNPMTDEIEPFFTVRPTAPEPEVVNPVGYSTDTQPSNPFPQSQSQPNVIPTNPKPTINPLPVMQENNTISHQNNTIVNSEPISQDTQPDFVPVQSQVIPVDNIPQETISNNGYIPDKNDESLSVQVGNVPVTNAPQETVSSNDYITDIKGEALTVQTSNDNVELAFEKAQIQVTTSVHDRLFSEDNKSLTVMNTQNVPPKPIKKKKGIKFFSIIFILFLVGAIAFLWLKIIPGLLAGEKLSTVATQALNDISKDQPAENIPPVVEEEVIKVDPATAYNYKAVQIIEPQWDEVSAFDENGLAKVKTEKGWGIINKQGTYIFQPAFESISQFSEGFAPVKSGDKYGYIGIDGNTAIPLEYDSATEFSEGMALVSKDSRYYYITPTGELKDFGGSLGTPFSEGLAAIFGLEGAYYINSLGEKVSGDYDEAGRFSENLAPVKMNNKWGYIDSSFNIVIDYSYDEAGSFLNGFAIVKKDGKKFLIDITGSQRSPMVDEIWPFKDGLATVKDVGLFGFVDGNSLEYLIEPQYVDAYAFSEGSAAVSMNAGIWYYVDSNNQPLSDKVFDEAYRFNDGLACVKSGLVYTMVDKLGNQAFADTWEQVGTFSENILPVFSGGKWGFVEIVPNK